MGVGASLVTACGPSLGGDTDGGSEGSSATDASTTASGTASSGASLTAATAETQNSASDTVSESSDTADDSSTSWGCDPYTEEWTERVCLPPYGEGSTSSGTGGSSGGSSSGDSSSGGSSGTGGSSTGGSESATSTSTGSPGAGFCEGYFTDPPNFPDSNGAWPEGSDGPFEEGEECCFDVHYFVGYPCGRPFLVEGDTRVAASIGRGDWMNDLRPQLAELSVAQRTDLAQQWLADAQSEHASIASFARFSLELLALGAPADLLRGTHDAMNDELEHARACFALASAYAGEPLGPGPLALGAALGGDVTLERVVEAALIEGCVGETIAAMQAQLALANAGDPAVIEALEKIATDEAAHAALAWRFVRWALSQDPPTIRAVVVRTLGELAASPALDVVAFDGMASHGRLSSDALGRLRQAAIDQVIVPCAEALLAEPNVVAPQLSGSPIAAYLGSVEACEATSSTQTSSACGS